MTTTNLYAYFETICNILNALFIVGYFQNFRIMWQHLVDLYKNMKIMESIIILNLVIQ